MSYARWGQDGSDVYVFYHVNDYLCCCACDLQEVQTFSTSKSYRESELKKNRQPLENARNFPDWKTCSYSAMLDHLKDHVKAGHIVPEYVFSRLEKEMKEQ